jgi:hypothetical protein
MTRDLGVGTTRVKNIDQWVNHQDKISRHSLAKQTVRPQW